jgi:hypothetical protein
MVSIALFPQIWFTTKHTTRRTNTVRRTADVVRFAVRFVQGICDHFNLSQGRFPPAWRGWSGPGIGLYPDRYRIQEPESSKTRVT